MNTNKVIICTGRFIGKYIQIYKLVIIVSQTRVLHFRIQLRRLCDVITREIVCADQIQSDWI